MRTRTRMRAHRTLLGLVITAILLLVAAIGPSAADNRGGGGARHGGGYRGGVHGGAILTFADYALCLVAGRAVDGGTNSVFAMTVSIAVEFLDAGRTPRRLNTGTPIQSDSQVVTPPVHGNVSRTTSISS